MNIQANNFDPASVMNKTRCRRQNGGSMIEVVVTMVLVAVGLLGQAALMAQTSKSSTTSLMRSQATILAYDILERMRLNKKLGLYSTVLTAPPPPLAQPAVRIVRRNY